MSSLTSSDKKAVSGGRDHKQKLEKSGTALTLELRVGLERFHDSANVVLDVLLGLLVVIVTLCQT